MTDVERKTFCAALSCYGFTPFPERYPFIKEARYGK